jgi:hypothetical protein
MKVKGIYNSAQGKIQILKERKIFPGCHKMNPVVIIPRSITAIVNIGVWRKKNQGIGTHRADPVLQNHPGLLLDEQNQIVGKTFPVLNVAWDWMVGIMAAAVYGNHSFRRFPFRFDNKKSRLCQLIAL